LEQIGTPVDLYDRPESIFVADFIGKMNFVDGEWISSGGQAGSIRVGDLGSLPALAPRERNAVTTARRPIRATIRPERLQLFKRGDGTEHSLKGTIESVIFVGSYRTFLVRVGDALLQVQTPAAGGSCHIAQGDAVDVTCDPTAVQFFAELSRS
jgi:mannopine transport system ATP-binding protein